MQRWCIQRLTWLAVLCLLILSQTTSVHAQSSDDDATLKRYYAANGMLNRGLYDMALREYEAFLDAAPNHPKAVVARYGAGVCLFRTTQYADAIDMLAPIASDNSQSFAAETRTIIGQSHMQLGQHDDAADAFEQVLTHHGDHDLADEAAAMRAECLFHLKRFDEAAAQAAIVTRRWSASPMRDRAELFGGLSTMALGDYAAAAEQFQTMLGRAPEGPHADQAELLLAQCMHRNRQLPAALQLYRRLMERDDSVRQADAMYGMAAVLYEQSQHADAAEILDELAERFPRFNEIGKARLLRAQVAVALDDIRLARTLLEPLAEDDETNIDVVQYWTAKCELRGDDPTAAAARLQDAIDEYPQSSLRAEMLYDRAIALSRLEQDEPTLVALDAFLAESEDHALTPDALHLKANLQYRLGEYARCTETAQAYFTDYSAHPHAADMLFLAAESLFLREELDAALPLYERYRAEFPDGDERHSTLHRLGMTHYRQGRFDEALPLLIDAATHDDVPAHFAGSLLALGDLFMMQESYGEARAAFEQYRVLSPDGDRADVLLKIGLCHHRADALTDAMSMYESVWTQYPEHALAAQAWFEHGQAALSLDDLDAAQVSLTQAINLSAENALAMHAWNHLGVIAMRQDDPDAAAKAFRACAALADDPNLVAEAKFNQAQALMLLGDDDAALAQLNEVLEHHSDHPRAARAAVHRCLCLARLGAHADALQAMGELTDADLAHLPDPLRATVRYEQAWCHRSLDDNDAARRAYTRLLQESPDAALVPNATLERADLEAAAGEHDVAARTLASLVDDDSLDPSLRREAQYRAGIAAFELETFNDAAVLLEAVLAADAGDELARDAQLLCAEVHFHRNAHGKVVQHLDAFLDQSPNHPQRPIAMLRLGESLSALQSWARSEATFAAFLKDYGDHDHWYQARFGLGWAHENQGRHAQAIKEYERVANEHGGVTAARAQFQIGECLYAMKDFEAATRELIKVDILFAYPQWSAAALYEAGRCFLELKDPVQARCQFEDVVNRFDGTEWSRLASARLEEMSRTGLPGRDGAGH